MLPANEPRRRTVLLLLTVILLVAGVVRFNDLHRIPRGVWMDEALKGVEGRQAVETAQFKLFYPANYGREGLWINMVGLSESVFGVNQFGLRFWSALTGTLTVLFLFLLAKDLFSDRVAILAAWFLATGFWHVLFSRLAFRAILAPFLLTASFALLAHACHAIEKEGPSRVRPQYWAALGGLFFGLGFHSYIAYRLAPLLAVIWFVLLWKRSARRREAVGVMATWLGVAILAALPIGIYFLAHPPEFFGRAEQVSIFADPHPFRVFGKVLLRTAGMFNLHGDCSWRHNIHCQPELILPVGILFLLGLGVVLIRWKRRTSAAWAELAVLSWFVVMMVPEVLTFERVPHALRALVAVPAIYLLVAIGADAVWQRLEGHRVWLRLFVLIVFLSGAYDVYRYFHSWANNPGLKATQAFNPRQAEIGHYFDSLPPNIPRYVLLEASVFKLDPARHEPWPPMMAEPIAFATYGHVAPVYLFTAELFRLPDVGHILPKGSVIATVEADPETWSGIEPRQNLSETRARELFAELEKHGVRLSLFRAGETTYARVE